LEQHDDPPDYSSEEATADQEQIESAIAEQRLPEFVVEPAQAEKAGRESAEGADVVERPRDRSSEATPEATPRRTEIPPADAEARAAFGGKLAEIVAKNIWSGEPAQVIAPSRMVAQVATAERRQPVSGPSMEPQPAERPRFNMPRPFIEREKVSGEPATAAQRVVQFHVSPDFAAEAMALFTEYDRDVPVAEEGSMDIQHPQADYRQPDPTPATDDLVNRAYAAEVYHDTKADRRIR
jgi:hypothetical protein